MAAAKSAAIYGSRISIWSAKTISFLLALASWANRSLKTYSIVFFSLLTSEDSPDALLSLGKPPH